jgi:Zn-dependent M28 family amino/carboxypeptidase
MRPLSPRFAFVDSCRSAAPLLAWLLLSLSACGTSKNSSTPAAPIGGDPEPDAAAQDDSATQVDATQTDAGTADVADADGSVDQRTMQERMRETVTKLSVTWYPRDYLHQSNLDAAAAWIGKELASTGASLSDQTYAIGGTTYRNVIASYGPDTPSRVIVGAHYDAVKDVPGADDNASGVAGLLEVGRLLAKDAPSLRVELVAFTLEEPPYFATGNMGSAVHAKSLSDGKVECKAMIALEMIGYYSEQAGSQTFPISGMTSIYGDVGNFIAVVGRSDQKTLVDGVRATMGSASGLRVEPLAAPSSMTGVDFSDHRSYWTYGWPAVMVTDTAFYRNGNYHKATDTQDTLDFAKMELVVVGVHAAVKELSAAK